ncbi:SH2 domain-containing protein 4A-like [Diorhabda sublineata]|uniref:SH2 domain-containing protein 4A-like n=1 Tax=Diorhabda sublineata TaxID=1163346 RepID=UPI0024E0F5FC|nr:SH2 domain-containing protein 4A-like [Diorhabda sublineata]
MLQQILRDMYVDPEILAELDEDQKQTLFCKMREEQVKRWKAWNDKLGDEIIKENSKETNKKKVKFLLGIDDEPWVWVMGEHENDKSIEDILREEAAEKARILAVKETEKLREEVRKEMKAQLIEDYVDLTATIEKDLPKLRIEDDVDIYCSVEQIQAKIHSIPKKNNNNYSINYYSSINNKFNDASEVKNTRKVAQKVALWEQKLLNDKTTEIFQKIQMKHQQVAKEAEEEEKRKEQVWREQERKAKAAEQQIREIARRAREEHKLNSSLNLDSTCGGTNSSGVPPSRQAVIDWYKNEEKNRRAGIDSSNNVTPWFHGLITRREAEKLLLDQPCGTFLVRLSEKIWGYAVSYRAQEKCKHYLVNAIPKYSFVGNNQKVHDTLDDIIAFHRTYPLTGGETLQYPCPRISTGAIEELLN